MLPDSFQISDGRCNVSHDVRQKIHGGLSQYVEQLPCTDRAGKCFCRNACYKLLIVQRAVKVDLLVTYTGPSALSAL